MKKFALFVSILFIGFGSVDAQHDRLSEQDLKPVQGEINRKLNELCRCIMDVGTTPTDQSQETLNKAWKKKRTIIVSDVPHLFLDYEKRKMKTSWYDSRLKQTRFRSKLMKDYFIALMNQAMRGREFRSYELWVEESYVNRKLGDPKNWMKEGVLQDGTEIWVSKAEFFQEYCRVISNGSMENKQEYHEKEKKTLHVYLAKMAADQGGDIMILLGDVIRTQPE